MSEWIGNLKSVKKAKRRLCSENLGFQRSLNYSYRIISRIYSKCVAVWYLLLDAVSSEILICICIKFLKCLLYSLKWWWCWEAWWRWFRGWRCRCCCGWYNCCGCHHRWLSYCCYIFPKKVHCGNIVYYLRKLLQNHQLTRNNIDVNI